MENYNQAVSAINSICTAQNKDDVRNILVLYDDKRLAIGDACIRLANLRYMKEYFRNAAVDINFVNTAHLHIYSGLLLNNPEVDNILAYQWDEIDFSAYDAVFFGAFNEEEFVRFLDNRYNKLMTNGQFKTAIYSFSQIILPPEENVRYILPVNHGFINAVRKQDTGKGKSQIYLSKSECDMADRWLEDKGMGVNERLVIFLDSTTRKNKLIPVTVYFEILTAVLQQDNLKVLIFDEKSIGKEEFYNEWLGEAYMKKMIFSKSRTFREDLALLGSGYTKMIFGPCTGLLHCASAIYNNRVNNGMPVSSAPVMITYTGQYNAVEISADIWWGKSPLVTCLLLKEKNGKKEMVELSSLTEAEKKSYIQVAASEYTAEMLTGFIETKLAGQQLAAVKTAC
jgi:ADP-heptose:LPS heptosyltransferase